MKYWVFIMLVLGGCRTTFAQQPSDSPVKQSVPDGPLLRPAPSFAQWEITFQYSDDQRKKEQAGAPGAKAASTFDPRPRKVVTTKTGAIIHEEVTCVDGKAKHVWFNAGTQYVKHGGQSVWLEADPRKSTSGVSGDPDADPMPPSGFRKLEWVTSNNYAGTIPYAGGNCFVFVPGGESKVDLHDSAKQAQLLSSQGTVAYIDAESRMPVAVRSEGETRSFHFNPTPSAMQALPADLANQIKKGEEGRARLDQRAPRPY